MKDNSFIGEIIYTLIGYVSEKRMDSISSKLHDILKRNNIKEEINEQLKIALDEFKDSSKDEEYVFDGLTETLKNFSTKDFLEAYAWAFSEPDQLEKAQEQILNICIRNTHTEKEAARDKVKNILNNCFNIVEYQLILELSQEDLTQIGLINKYTYKTVKKIVEITNGYTDTKFDEFKDFLKNLMQQLNLPTSTPDQNETEFDTLKEGRKLSEQYFTKLRKHGRFKGYIDTTGKRIPIENKLKIPNVEKGYELHELVFDIVKDNSISLHGKGGTGKTFQLLSL